MYRYIAVLGVITYKLYYNVQRFDGTKVEYII